MTDNTNLTAPAVDAALTQEPVLWQYKTWPVDRDEDSDRFPWVDCSEASYRERAKLPLYNDWRTEVRALYAAPQPEASVASDRETLRDLIAEHLSGTYHCTRSWSGWHVGTMTQNDFSDVGESDTPADIADAILAAAPRPAASAALTQEPPPSETFMCKAWGETDLPSIAIVHDFDAIRAFMVEQWLGSADAQDYDGTETLPRTIADMLEHWEVEGKDSTFSIEFEIGGISVERVDWISRTATPQLAASVASGGEAVLLPMQGDEGEADLSDLQPGTSKPNIDGTYLREFDEGSGTSEFHEGKWLRDGFFPSDVQDAAWRGRRSPAATAPLQPVSAAGNPLIEKNHVCGVTCHPEGANCNGYCSGRKPAPARYLTHAAPLQPRTPAEPLTESYVQTVPDHCDRIVWRGSYHHLPLPDLAAQRRTLDAPSEAPALRRIVAACLTALGNGSGADPVRASLAFLENAPLEVAAVVKDLRAELAAGRAATPAEPMTVVQPLAGFPGAGVTKWPAAATPQQAIPEGALAHITITDLSRLNTLIGRIPAHEWHDHACQECVPFSDILREGFQCAVHAARAAQAKGGTASSGSTT